MVTSTMEAPVAAALPTDSAGVPSVKGALSASEIARFQSDGFLVRPNVISLDEVDRLREAADAMSEDVRRMGGEESTVHLLNLTTKNLLFLDLAKDPRIVGLITSLIGPDVQLEHSKLAAPPASKGRGGFGWHQDFAFFPHTNRDLIAVMVMLDDATPENGCMHMVRGSHRIGVRDHTKDGFFTMACQESELWEGNSEEVVAVTPPAGGVSIHHCLTLHGSGPNKTGRPRRGLVFQYRASDAYQLAGTVWEDTGIVVSGKFSEYVRCEPQTVLLPRSPNRFTGNPYGNPWNQRGAFAKEQNDTSR